MPIFKAGKGKWTKLCEVCGKPFIKTARVQKKCPACSVGKGGGGKKAFKPKPQ